MIDTSRLLCVGLACTSLLPVLAGCGGSSSTNSPTPTPQTVRYDAALAAIPACAHAGKAVSLPNSFPRAFPFPGGSAITSTSTQFGATVINGYVPSKNFNTTLQFFMKGLPAAGFRIGDHDAEPPREGEGEYIGHGFVGRFKIRSIAGCSGALTFQASSKKGQPVK